jgi:DUF2934 family protein
MPRKRAPGAAKRAQQHHEPGSQRGRKSTTRPVDSARQAMIAEAAYYLAEKRGFAPGRELDDWLSAETDIAESLLEQRPGAADLH